MRGCYLWYRESNDGDLQTDSDRVKVSSMRSVLLIDSHEGLMAATEYCHLKIEGNTKD